MKLLEIDFSDGSCEDIIELLDALVGLFCGLAELFKIDRFPVVGAVDMQLLKTEFSDGSCSDIIVTLLLDALIGLTCRLVELFKNNLSDPICLESILSGAV